MDRRRCSVARCIRPPSYPVVSSISFNFGETFNSLRGPADQTIVTKVLYMQVCMCACSWHRQAWGTADESERVENRVGGLEGFDPPFVIMYTQYPYYRVDAEFPDGLCRNKSLWCGLWVTCSLSDNRERKSFKIIIIIVVIDQHTVSRCSRCPLYSIAYKSLIVLSITRAHV